MIDLTPIWLSIKLAVVTTIILLFAGLIGVYWVKNKSRLIQSIFAAFIASPLVIPPTVLGLYFLMVFGPASWFGEGIFGLTGIQLIFSFPGLVMASIIYSLPFMVQPILDGQKNIPKNLIFAAQSMGKSKFTVWKKIEVPMLKNAIVTGIMMSFAHTLGEFGVIYMIGGSIPGETKVASIAIFESVEGLNYENAHTYALVLLILGLSTVFISNFVFKTKND